ncbi:nuclear protein localization protein 4, partial [Kickxella alabastrina]
YLLVNLTHGFPNEPNPLFKSEGPFYIENREHLQQVQTLGLVKNHIAEAQGSLDKMAALLSDFHFLVYLSSLDILSADNVKLIGRIITAETPEMSAQLTDELLASDGWQTLSLMLQEASDSDLNHGAGSAMDTGDSSDGFSSGAQNTSSAGGSGGRSSSPWACRHCTFENSPANDSCDMCALPRD